MRKAVPLERALADFEAWIMGLKRYHGAKRDRLPTFELSGGRIKVNPVADWMESDVATAPASRDPQRHPLLDEGFRSIGCAACTAKPRAGAGVRSRRWAGLLKMECGIHRMP